MTDRKQPPAPAPEDPLLERASRTIDHLIGAGEAQQGDRAERAAELGGAHLHLPHPPASPVWKAIASRRPIATDDSNA